MIWCSPLVLEVVYGVEMAVATLSVAVDTIGVASTIVVAHESIIITELWAENIIKGVWRASPPTL